MEGQSVNIRNLRESASIGAVGLALGLLFNFLFFEKIPGLGIFVYTLIIIIGLYSLARSFNYKINKEVKWLVVPVLFLSAMVFVRASVMLVVLDIIGVLLLLLVIAAASQGDKIRDYVLINYFEVLFVPLKCIIPLYDSVATIGSSFSASKDEATTKQVRRGIALTIPIVLVFLLLFSSADLIFQNYVSEIFNFDLEACFRLFWIVIVTGAFIGGYSYIFLAQRSEKAKKQPPKTNGKFGPIENTILFSSINILFFTFILIQITYLFGGEKNIALEGFTYAEYARKGFGELVWGAIFSLLLLLITEKYSRDENGAHTLSYKLLSSMLVVQVTMIIASAFMRLLMYEQAYGFTTMRLYSHAFVIWLAVVFLLVLGKVFFDKKESSFTLRVFISMILFLVCMNLLNPDAFIAKKNIERYHTTGQLDIDYILSLSDDAIPAIMNAAGDADGDARSILGRKLSIRYTEKRDSSYYEGWQSWNLSRIQADRILGDRIDELNMWWADSPE